MQIVRALLLCLLVAGCSQREKVGEPARRSEQEAVAIVNAANRWTAGAPIPDGILTYSSDWVDWSCFPLMTGTETIVQRITNYALLKEIVLTPDIDARVFTNVTKRALVFAGPKRFFGDMMQEQSVPEAIRSELAVPHIVVESIYIDFTRMTEEEALRVLTEMKQLLEKGRAFEEVHLEFRERFTSIVRRGLGDEEKVKQSISKIGYLGVMHIPENENLLFSYAESNMPKDHIEALFEAKQGEVLILRNKENRAAGRYVLHHVREAYVDNRTNSRMDHPSAQGSN